MHDPPRILIVDDHETNRDILATRLATQGYDLCQATDGQEALDAAKRLLPDLILLDVMMPKLNGIEVCRRLKGDAALPFMSISKTRFDIAQAFTIRNLCERHNPEMFCATQGADANITTVLCNYAMKTRPRNKIHHLREKRSACVHRSSD